MKRITRRKKRILTTVKVFKNLKRLSTTRFYVPAAAIHFVEASKPPELMFKVRVVYGKAKTNFGKIEEIDNEVGGTQEEVLPALRTLVDYRELDAIEKYWEFV